jgi:Leucine-rich repeat (LRR) protein
MLEAARQLALAQPLPDDAAAIFELFHATVGRDDNDAPVSLSLPVFGTTDATMPLLAKLPSLTSLSCRQVDAEKKSFAVVAQLPKLESLDLSSTSVDDNAVGYLSEMKSLRVLSIADTNISQAGYEKLKAALADCEIRK